MSDRSWFDLTYQELLEKDGGADIGHLSKEYTCWCGLCSHWYQKADHLKVEAERNFKKIGWRKTSKHGWLCPWCYGAYKNRKK